MNEKLSALIDNELDELERARLLRELNRSAELAERWSRYHLIGLAMRGETIVSMANDLPERVARALESDAERSVEAPRVDDSIPHRHWTGRYRIAASVAAVLLLGGLIFNIYDASDRPETTAGQQLAVNDTGMRWEGADARSEAALNTFLIEHGEFTSASGMNGLTAYTKFIAYDSQ